MRNHEKYVRLDFYTVSQIHKIEGLLHAGAGGIQREIRPFREPTGCDLYSVRACKEIIYNEINAYNKISGKIRL